MSDLTSVNLTGKNTHKQERGVFVGNSLDFSDTVLRLAGAEFECLHFIRVASFDALFGLAAEMAPQCRLIIVSEALAAELQNNLPVLQDRFGPAQFVLAYRKPEIARDFMLRGTTRETLARIGFLPMALEIDRWMAILRLLICGERYVPYELFDSDAAAPGAGTAQEPQAAATATKLARLTERELQVLSCVSEGKQNKIIAAEMELSEHTVKLHIHNMISKLGVNNRTEAAIFYLADQAAAGGAAR